MGWCEPLAQIAIANEFARTSARRGSASIAYARNKCIFEPKWCDADASTQVLQAALGAGASQFVCYQPTYPTDQSNACHPGQILCTHSAAALFGKRDCYWVGSAPSVFSEVDVDVTAPVDRCRRSATVRKGKAYLPADAKARITVESWKLPLKGRGIQWPDRVDGLNRSRGNGLRLWVVVTEGKPTLFSC
ncbi:hypothetical protein SAMN05445850_7150 [Paraburkholderia tuberum]|uniref:Uncharacterized protein n=1 Tax=Paraburkholderia tuberum TaxID=157910 RepID=A0A1H1KDK9_9BURK|nr:hypothetical protein SAMN05445850_7150 [Paraburkholderia tuberum]